MNAIELLKEAWGASVKVLDGLNARIDRASKQGEPIPVYDGIVELHDLIAKINAYLATPAPDAMGLVEKIRGFSACILQRKPSMRTDNDPGEVEKISTDWMLSEVEAAALIESYGRRVPRAIDAIAGKLEEAIGEEDWNEAKSVLNDLWDLRDDGYKVEG